MIQLIVSIFSFQVLHSIKNDPVSCDSRKNSFQYSLDRTLAKCSEKLESSTRSNLEFVSQQLRRSAQLLLDEAMNQSKNDQKDPFCSQHGTISTTCIRLEVFMIFNDALISMYDSYKMLL